MTFSNLILATIQFNRIYATHIGHKIKVIPPILNIVRPRLIALLVYNPYSKLNVFIDAYVYYKCGDLSRKIFKVSLS